MPKARQAWINKNKIAHLKKGIFTNTNFNLLYLCSNEITTIEPEAFYGMKNLGYLNLEGNKLSTFRPERYIGKSLTLEILNLSKNQITTVKKFPEMPKLISVDYGDNVIKSFEDYSFENTKKLYTVIFSHNQIEQLRTNIFSKECNIGELLLDHNKLKYIQPNTLQKLSKLKNVTVDGNPWSCPCQLDLKSHFEQHKIIVHDSPDKKMKDCKKEKNAQCVYK